MAELSEMYQASLKPLPPNKPLPDETGFQNYFSPPPVGPNYFMPNYYFYPQAYPQPPPVYTLPPLPPAPVYAAASPEELEAFRANAPPNSVDSRRPASNTSEVGQPALNFLLCGLLLFVVLLLFGMAFMMAYAMAEKRSVARNEKTQGDDEGFATSRDDDAGRTVRRKAEDTTTLVSAQSKTPVALEQRENSGKISPNS